MKNNIISIKYGESVLSENAVFQGGDKNKVLQLIVLAAK